MAYRQSGSLMLLQSDYLQAITFYKYCFIIFHLFYVYILKIECYWSNFQYTRFLMIVSKWTANCIYMCCGCVYVCACACVNALARVCVCVCVYVYKLMCLQRASSPDTWDSMWLDKEGKSTCKQLATLMLVVNLKSVT
jgi:hypothetical protein